MAYKNPKDPRARASRMKWYRKNKDKQIARQLERRIEFREYVLQQKDGPCVDCGGTFHFSVMDFDHLPGCVKRVKLSNAHSYFSSIASIQKEIDKCALVCANCHRVRTYNRSLLKKQISLQN